MKTKATPAPSMDRDIAAALLSIVPGAGHLYKHHYVSGFGFLLGGNLLMILVSALLIPATLGLSVLIIPPVYVAAVAFAAYSMPDWHGHHHYLHPWDHKKPPSSTEEA